jgi:hypothetical protein
MRKSSVVAATGIALVLGLGRSTERTSAQSPPSEGFNIVTVAGAGPDTGDGGPAVGAHLDVPSSVTFDSLGNLYIAETSMYQVPPSPLHHRIRRVDKVTGIITTVAGTGVPGYSGENLPATSSRITGPVRILFDRNDDLLINGGSSSNRIQKVDGTTGLMTTVVGTSDPCPPPGIPACGDGGTAASARVSGPFRGSAFDSSGNFYFSESNRIRIVTRRVENGVPQPLDGTEIIGTFAGTGVMGGMGDGGLAATALLNSPRGLTFDASGENLFIADLGNHRVRKINLATGVITTVAGTGTACAPATEICGDGGPAISARLVNPTDVNFDSAGNLFVNQSNHRIRKVDTSGIITTVAGTGEAGFAGDGGPAILARLNGLRGGKMDGADNFYFADTSNNRIRRLNVAASVDVDPATINIAHAKGRWITAYIQFPATRDAHLVDPDSVRLQAIDPADGSVRLSAGNQVLQVLRAPGSPVDVTNMNQLMLKFDRATVAGWAAGTSDLVLRAEGQFATGTYFSGDTEIRLRQNP